MFKSGHRVSYVEWIDLSDRWVEESEQLLKRMKALIAKEERDRLEVVGSMLFILDVMERSLDGWKQWVRNLSLMSQYPLEELVEMQRSLEKQIQPLIEYDIEASKRWSGKFPQVRVFPGRKREEEESRGLYV